MATTIHPTAIVSPEAQLADGVDIGPYCIISGKVTLAEGVRLISHVNISGPVSIGARTILYPGCCIGFPGQDCSGIARRAVLASPAPIGRPPWRPALTWPATEHKRHLIAPG